MERTTEYQICVLSKAANGDTVVAHTENVFADTIAGATEQATAKGYKLADVRVYPFCTPSDGEGQMELARHTLASYENWERRNSYAVLNPQDRNEWEREDLIMIACVAILAVFEGNPNANMHELKTTAFSAIRTEQGRKERNSKREFFPGWTVCNVTPRQARASCPQLDRLIRESVKTANLTDGQMSAPVIKCKKTPRKKCSFPGFPAACPS